MIKSILKVLVVVGLVSSLSYAGNMAASSVTKYEVTVQKLELYNSTTATWITIANTPKAVNIASATAGADVASMISSDAQVPFGTFTKGRVTFADTFTINACIVAGNCTNGTAVIADAFGGTLLGDTTIAVAGAVNGVDTVLNVDFVALHGLGNPALFPVEGVPYTDSCSLETTFATPLVVDETTTGMEMKISFNIDNVLNSEAGPAITLDFPGIDVTIQ